MVNWLGENWMAVVLIANTIILLAGRIAKLTPTKTDDRIVAKIQRFMLTIGLEPKGNG